MERHFEGRAYREEGVRGDSMSRYVESVFQPEDEGLRKIREDATKNRVPPIHVRKMDGLHLEVITRMVGAAKVVEVGTLVGYSTVCLARGLSTGGKVYTIERNPVFARAAKRNFDALGVADRVEVIVGPALKCLTNVERHGPFDLIFIDADKETYPQYLTWAEEHLRIGGVVLGDNTLAFGMIGEENIEDPHDEAMVAGVREFNRRIAQGGRFRGTLLPTGEGLTLGVKLR